MISVLSFEFQLHAYAGYYVTHMHGHFLSTALDDVSNAIAAATAVHQDSLALLISIYNRASILTCRNGDHLSYNVAC